MDEPSAGAAPDDGKRSACPRAPDEAAVATLVGVERHRLADDSAADEQSLLRHAAVQLHLLPPLIRAGEGQRALACWRRLSQATPGPTQLPGLTLQLARLLGQGRDLRGIGELTRFLHSRYPEAEQTRQLALLQQHLAR